MSALAVNPLHLDDTGIACLVILAHYFGIPANVTQLKHRFDEAGKAVDRAKLLLAAARRFCYRIPREPRPQLLSRITCEGQWSGEPMLFIKRTCVRKAAHQCPATSQVSLNAANAIKDESTACDQSVD